jgi:hypothetical protein
MKSIIVEAEIEAKDEKTALSEFFENNLPEEYEEWQEGWERVEKRDEPSE